MVVCCSVFVVEYLFFVVYVFEDVFVVVCDVCLFV